MSEINDFVSFMFHMFKLLVIRSWKELPGRSSIELSVVFSCLADVQFKHVKYFSY